jgi:phasin family protein
MYSAATNQFLSAAKSFFETQIDVLNRLNTRHLEGYSNLIDLNMHMMKTSLDDSSKRMHAFLSSRNSAELFSAVPTESPPYAVQLISYGKDVADITAEMRDELFKATQVELAETGKEMSSIVGYMVERETDALKNGTDVTKSTLKSMEAAQSEAVEVASKKARKLSKATSKTSTHHLSHAKKASSHAGKRSSR